MITVTKLNGSQVVVNAELIETLECTPDTILTLTTGKKFLIKDPVDAVVAKVVDYKKSVLSRVTIVDADKRQGA